MSSHHIVRENQEPALLIADVLAIDAELLGQLLEWSPTIMTNETSYEILHSQGYKVDFVLTNQNTNFEQAHLQTLIVDEGDFISQGISLLLEKNHRAVNIIANDINEDSVRQFADLLTIVWIHHSYRSVFIHSGFEKWKPKGERLFLEDTVENLSVDGLVQVADHVFETTADGFYKINFSNLKPVLLTEQI